MARQYLRVGSREIPVTDDQARQLNQFRFFPKKIAEVKFQIFSSAGMKPDDARQAAGLSPVTAS